MKLSVIIVSYNSKHVLEDCLKYLKERLGENFSEAEYEIIVVDNASEAPEQAWLKKIPGIKTVFLTENFGFAKGNNVGLTLARGEYVLYLNSDVYLKEKIDFPKLFSFLEEDEKRAGLTVRVLLGNDALDKASHRGFPTPWNAFAYFSGLAKLFRHTPLNGIFGGYHLEHLPLGEAHEIDSPTAAFFLVKKKILDHLHGFDEDYFFYGEDLDLAYRIKALGYSIWYYPAYEVRHLKYQSGQKAINLEHRKFSRKQFYKTMLTFYDKHYAQKYPKVLNMLVRMGVKLLGKIKK